MTRLGKALKLNDSIRIKTFELGGNTLKVRVPLTKELDEVNKSIIEISQDDIKARLDKMTSALLSEKVEGVEVKDDDLVVNGISTKETITSILMMEKKITEYFKFLVPEEGNFDDISYEEIDSEFPLQVQFELLEKINEVIQPGYKDARKN